MENAQRVGDFLAMKSEKGKLSNENKNVLLLVAPTKNDVGYSEWEKYIEENYPDVFDEDAKKFNSAPYFQIVALDSNKFTKG